MDKEKHLFNGVVLPDEKGGTRVKFSRPVSSKVRVDNITIRNHPAYNRRGTAKQLTATEFIAEGEYIGYYGGKIILIGDQQQDEDQEQDYNEEEEELPGISDKKKRKVDDKGKEELSEEHNNDNNDNEDDDVILYDEMEQEEEKELTSDWNPYQITPDENEYYYIDGDEIGNEMKYINDSKGIGTLEPNVKFFPSIRRTKGYIMVEVKAIKDIQPGEEILASYGNGYWNSLNLWWKRENPYTCSECDFRANTKIRLASHLFYEKTKKENEENGYILNCNYCDAKFKDKYRLRNHINTHTQERKYKCNKCSFETYDPSRIYDHKQRHKGVKLKCYICGKLKENSQDLREHILLVHQKLRRYKCDIDGCNKTFQKFGGLKNHKIAFHENLRQYKCSQCKSTFNLKSTLDKHVQDIHEKKKRYKCYQDGCNYTSFYKNNVVSHMDSVHKTEDRFSCSICNYKTNLKRLLSNHMKHHGEKIFHCESCEFKGATKLSLDSHKKCHDEKSFICGVCPYKTNRELCLNKHIERIHDTTKRPVICDICGHATGLETSMVEHKRNKHGYSKKRSKPDEDDLEEISDDQDDE
jgi:hypothetical protein